MIILFLFIVSFHAQAAFNEGESRVNQSLESGLAISSSSASRILGLYNFKKEGRTDYYFEIYDGQNFLWELDSNHYKLRLKVEEKKWLLQATTSLKETPFTCDQVPALTVKFKTIEELFVHEDDRDQIASATEAQLESLEFKNTDQTIQAIRKLDSNLRYATFPAIDLLKSVGAGRKFAFVGTFIAKKIKSKFSFNTPDGPIVVSVTEGEDFLGQNSIQKRSEIEFQAEPSMSPPKYMQHVCQIMSDLKLTSQDVAPERIDLEAITLNKLRNLPTGPTSW